MYRYAFTLQTLTRAVNASLLLAGALFAHANSAIAASTNSQTPVELNGILRMVHTDDFAHGSSSIHYKLEEALSKRHYRLKFEGEAPAGLRSGISVKIKGKPTADNVIMLSGGTIMQTVSVTSGRFRHRVKNPHFYLVLNKTCARLNHGAGRHHNKKRGK